MKKNIEDEEARFRALWSAADPQEGPSPQVMDRIRRQAQQAVARPPSNVPAWLALWTRPMPGLAVAAATLVIAVVLTQRNPDPMPVESIDAAMVEAFADLDAALLAALETATELNEPTLPEPDALALELMIREDS